MKLHNHNHVYRSLSIFKPKNTPQLFQADKMVCSCTHTPCSFELHVIKDGHKIIFLISEIQTIKHFLVLSIISSLSQDFLSVTVNLYLNFFNLTHYFSDVLLYFLNMYHLLMHSSVQLKQSTILLVCLDRV